MRTNPASTASRYNRAWDLHVTRCLFRGYPMVSIWGRIPLRDAHRILVIDSNDWDAELVRASLRELPRPVRLLRDTDLDRGERVDLIIVGFTDAVSMETARPILEKARVASPGAQLILCVPRDLPDLDRKVLTFKARALVHKPVDPEMLRNLVT